MFGMNRKVDRLMLAMAEHEGWVPLTATQADYGSRAYRHHNPGNLRRSPFAHSVVDGYAVFQNDIVGWNAFHWDLMQKARGQTVTKLGPKSTLRDLIFTWAPPSDNNNSEAYLQDVVKKSGLPETITLAEIFSN